jgi:tyrosine--tRNA ligase
MNIIDDLEWRGAINQMTDEEGLRALTSEKAVSLYCGVDPTGDSMHIGHLIPFMILRRFQLAGHKPVILIGGATGSIGDPSGRTSERVLQSMEQVQHNVEKLTAQMKKLFFTTDEDQATLRLVNNYDWTKDLSLLDFLRDYGKHFNLNTMLAKDVVASRQKWEFHLLNSHTKSYNQWTSYIYSRQKTCKSKSVVQTNGGTSLQVLN